LDRQFGVITREQTAAAGLTKHALAHRLRSGGPWRTLLPGVYIAVTGTPSKGQLEMAALLYAGTRSILTGASALAYNRIRVRQSDIIDVLVPTTCQRRDAEFVRLRRTARMPDDPADFQGIRYARAPRAVGDAVRGIGNLDDVRSVISDAVQRKRCTLAELVAELNEGPRWGSALFREALAEVIGGSRSAAEAALRALIIKAKLELPLFNADIYDGETFIARPDAWYPELGIAIEVDSKEWHLGANEHKQTLRRGNRMEKYLINVLRFTPNDIRDEPEQVIREIRDAITRARGRPKLKLRTEPAPSAAGR
jgi:very-short-patch-repair endonuclease